ncbi:MAG: hypothetical protein JXB23_04045 [Candidatus Aminicenantes bacterium]|nr:hypothetical protein [Candidatus Aminicenantes bacterium]
MTQYLITLRPVDGFFFGGAETFGDGKNTNYLVRSDKLPQQTTLIGMLRKEILRQHGPFKALYHDYTNDEKTKMAERIGSKPFSFSGPNKFGALKRVSPVFLTDGTKNYIPIPLDHDINLIVKQDRIFGSTAMKIFRHGAPTGYDGKKGLPSGFMASNGECMDDEDIFIRIEKVGIRKDKWDEDDEKAFYKQTRYKLKRNFRFAFIVDCDLNLGNALVEMGGERSIFAMTVTETSDCFEKIFSAIHCSGHLLLADTLTENAIYDACTHAIADIVPFRHFENQMDKYKSLDKSPVTFLLKRGTVLYGDRGKIEACLNKDALTRCGFNIVKYIN